MSDRIVITVAVPAGLERETVERQARQAVDFAIERMEREKKRADEQLAALETDEGLSVWVASHFHGSKPWDLPPVVRASTYEDVSGLEMYGMWDFTGPHGRDPRRPVFMRGCLGALREAHGCDGWLGRVAERYLRMTKWTCLDWDEIHDTIHMIRSWMVKKWPTFGSGKGSRIRELTGSDGWRLLPPCWVRLGAEQNPIVVWIDGKRLTLTSEKLGQLQALAALVSMIDDAEAKSPRGRGRPAKAQVGSEAA